MSNLAFAISATDAAVLLRGQAAPDRRQAVHVMFLLDISDSMSDGHKLSNVKKSIEFLVPLLQPEDAVSIVTFGENSAVVLQPTPATERDLILGKVSVLRTDGCTNMSAGLMSVRDVIERASPRKQGIFLLTDGHANRGVSDPDGLKRIVQSLLTDHPELTLTTFGYGVDHNVPLLTDIATAGGGSYNVVYNLENVATTFGEALGGLTTVVAQNVTLLLPEDAEPLTGYKVIKTAGEPTQVRIGDVYAENQVVVLFRLGADATLPVGLTFHDMLGLRSVTESLTIGPVPAAADGGVPKIVEQAQFRYKVSEILKEATRNLLAAGLKGRAEALLAQLKELPYFQEQLIQMMIDDLEDLLEGIDRAEAPYDGNIPAAVALGATPSAPAARQTSQWGQHSAYLALGRGLRSLAPEPDDDPYAYHHGPLGAAPTGGFGVGPAPLGRVSSLAPAYGGGGGFVRQNAVHFAATAAAQDPDEDEGTPLPTVSPPLGPTPAPGLAPAPTSRIRTAVVDAESSPFMNLPQMRMASLMRASSSAAAPPLPSARQSFARSRSPTPPPAGGRLMRSSGAAPAPAAAAPSSPLARSATSVPPGLAPSATSPSGGGE